jgi:membrane fusion protein, multidrug efflux system
MNVSAYAEVRPSRRRVVTLSVIVGLLAVVFFGLVFATPIATFFAKGGAAQFAQPPATVAAVQAQYAEWNPQTEIVGSLAPMQGADLSVEVPGTVAAIYFESGSDVKAGQPLIKLRDEDDVARSLPACATAPRPNSPPPPTRAARSCSRSRAPAAPNSKPPRRM